MVGQIALDLVVSRSLNAGVARRRLEPWFSLYVYNPGRIVAQHPLESVAANRGVPGRTAVVGVGTAQVSLAARAQGSGNAAG